MATAINRLPRETVERIAEGVLSSNGIHAYPVDPLLIAQKSGIEVKNAEFVDQNISGLISKFGNQISIFVKHDDSPNRKKFTIAHELGHFFLHLQEADGDFVEFRGYTQYETPHKEIEANQFAGALLMPQSLVEEAWHRGLGISEMAKHFGVSQDSMKYRLVNLGYLNVGMI